MTIGIIGGTFDPIHVGHLVAAEQAWTKLGLDSVLFIPAGQPWFKANNGITVATHRLEMLRLAIYSNPHFKLCTVELERPGPSYTIDTMIELRDRQGIHCPYFIIGMDSILGLPLWKEPEKLLQMCRFVVLPRSDLSKVEKLRTLEESVHGLIANVMYLDMPDIAISSSDIRKRIANRESIKYLVPAEVEQYIVDHRLYLH
jgi:nicotinate-nucleotide adenylyltransferase